MPPIARVGSGRAELRSLELHLGALWAAGIQALKSSPTTFPGTLRRSSQDLNKHFIMACWCHKLLLNLLCPNAALAPSPPQVLSIVSLEAIATDWEGMFSSQLPWTLIRACRTDQWLWHTVSGYLLGKWSLLLCVSRSCSDCWGGTYIWGR